MFLGGLFWTPIFPFAYYLMYSKLISESLGLIIIVSLSSLILEIAALLLFTNGLSMLIANGKKHLILNDDCLQIIINGGKYKGTVYDINYAEIKKFYFVSDGTKKDETTDKYFIKENSSGTINFYVGSKFYCASIYDAMPAAQFIINKLLDEQIDNSRNELDRSGNHHPKD